MENLQKELTAILSASKVEFGLYLAVNGRESFAINAKQKFHAASMIKVPLLFEALKQVQQGKVSLEKRYLLQTAEKVGGAGVLQLLDEGLNLTLQDLLFLMITVSDNTATNIIYDIVGKENVNQSIQQLGLKNTYLARKLMRYQQGGFSYTTAWDLGKLFEEIYKGSVLKTDLKNLALTILKKQQFNDCLSRDLEFCGNCQTLVGGQSICLKCGAKPNDTELVRGDFAHKTGQIIGHIHDGGIMEYAGHYAVIVLLTSKLPANQVGNQLHAEVGSKVMQFLNKI